MTELLFYYVILLSNWEYSDTFDQPKETIRSKFSVPHQHKSANVLFSPVMTRMTRQEGSAFIVSYTVASMQWEMCLMESMVAKKMI